MSDHPPKSALNVVSDAPDLRDRYYEPTLAPLRDELPYPSDLYIINQGREGACTGFGLAATINFLYRKQHKEHNVSPRMLYEMARRYDRWPGEDYEGSSCQGAIKGWQNSGVCLEELCPYTPGDEHFEIDYNITEDARTRTLGAYYRVRPDISEVHAALNESGVIYASASVHRGWFEAVEDNAGESFIPLHDKIQGGHAFAIVGYNREGFWVQNSWDESWDKRGVALWLYEDWVKNIKDAWVVQLALPTPQIFDTRFNAGQSSIANRGAILGSIPRVSIEEHFVHLDDGSYHDKGRYWSNREHMAIVQKSLSIKKFDHVLFYAHGGLNDTKASAKRIAAMKPVFLANGIYPFHFMYDTGLFEEIKDVLVGKSELAERISGGITDWFDRRIENLTQKPGRALWREIQRGARTPFIKDNSDGSDVLHRLIRVIKKLDKEVGFHVVGHSTGAILQAYLLNQAVKFSPDLLIKTCSLMAPAATNDLFNQYYKPLVKKSKISDLTIYNLTDKLEQDDNVAFVYRKSLLYLVSRSYEEKLTTQSGNELSALLLGMQIYNRQIDIENLPVKFVYSKGGKKGRSTSKSHGGFDNDPNTLNDIIKRILGENPIRPFTETDLDY